MAAVRGGQAKAVKPKPIVRVVPGTRGQVVIPPKKKAPPPRGGPAVVVPPPVVVPPARGGEAVPVVPPTPIDWASVINLDPGYNAVKAQSDANIANLNEAFDGAANPFSTVKQLKLSLDQNLRSNANAHASHGTLFGGGTAQGAENRVRDNTKARYDASQTLFGNIGQQQANTAAELAAASGRILANPEAYGLSNTAPGDPVEVAQNQAASAAVVPPVVAPKPFVTAAQLKKDPRAAQKKRNQ